MSEHKTDKPRYIELEPGKYYGLVIATDGDFSKADIAPVTVSSLQLETYTPKSLGPATRYRLVEMEIPMATDPDRYKKLDQMREL